MKSALLGVIGMSVLIARLQAQSVDTVISSNLFSEPHAVATDPENNLYILDGGTGNQVFKYSSDGVFSTVAGKAGPGGATDGIGIRAGFNDPKGMVYARNGLVIADFGNHLIRYVVITNGVGLTNGTVSTLAGVVSDVGDFMEGPPGVGQLSFPSGVAADALGNIYIADWGNGAIRMLDTNNYLTNYVSSGVGLPSAVAVGDNGDLWVADSLNSVIYRIDSNKVVTVAAGIYGSNGTNDSPIATEGRLCSPRSLLWQGAQSGLVISDTGNHTLRRLYFNPAPDVQTNSLETIAGIPGRSGFLDAEALSATLNVPMGLAEDKYTGGVYITDSANKAVRRRRQTSQPVLRVANPSIGYVTFESNNGAPPASLFNDLTGKSAVFYNPVVLAIKAEAGTETLFTYGATPTNSFNDTVTNPPASSHTPTVYKGDNLDESSSAPTIIADDELLPDLTIKAMSRQDGRPSSSIVNTRIQFKTGNPVIGSGNSASIPLDNATIGAAMYYTIDGSDPTNNSKSMGPNYPGDVLSFPLTKDVVIKMRAFKPKFEPSDISSRPLLVSNYVANQISFGFDANTGFEASSAFIGAAGQTFYAPVTLTLSSPTQTIFSLQFSITATNTASEYPVPPNYGFTSMLMKPIVGLVDVYTPILPMMYSNGFRSLLLRDTSINLLTVGWLERKGYTNLYDSVLQNLITYSQAHDTLFKSVQRSVIVGAYSFDIPSLATNGSVYQITIANPSGTEDGISKPVLLQAPTNGSRFIGPINSVKDVTVGSTNYVVGDVAPFRWFNAGDFGNGVLENNDVLQVFQSACYQNNTPPGKSDLFDSMDSSNGTTNFFLWSSGNDLAINTVSMGDGVLSVDDVYVTFRRSLDPSLTGYARFWTGGDRVSVPVTNKLAGQLRSKLPAAAHLAQATAPSSAGPHSIRICGADLTASSGSVVEIPITAQIIGDAPLRVFMMNLHVIPLDGSPALTNAVQFTEVENLATRNKLISSQGAANFSGAWLDTSVPGTSGTNIIGTLSIPLPGNVNDKSAYMVHFDHFSGSPNGLAVFPTTTQDTLVTLSDRTASSLNDGIPDTWRLRYFGTISNLLSSATADADGDGVSNQSEYLAGTSPVDVLSKLKLNGWAANQSAHFTLQWPTVADQQYAIECATSILSTNWTVISTNVRGDGSMGQFSDTNAIDGARFYRVHVIK